METPSLETLSRSFYETVSRGDQASLVELYRSALGLSDELVSPSEEAPHVPDDAAASEDSLRRRRALQSLLRCRHLSNLRCPTDFVYGDGTSFDGGSQNLRGGTGADAGTGTGTVEEGEADAAVVAGGLTGTLLHLAAIVDAPLCLATLIALGGDVHAAHTAFRRTVVHECAANGSYRCLDLLLGWSEAQRRRCENSPFSIGVRGHLHEKKMRSSHSSELEAALLDMGGGGEEQEEEDEGLFSVDSTVLTLSKMLREHEISSEEEELEVARQFLYGDLLGTEDGSDSGLGQPFATIASPPYPFSRNAPLPLLPDGHGNSPLHWSAFKNSAACLKLLLTSPSSPPISPNVVSVPSGWTPLHDASYSDAVACIHILLAAGADVDSRAASGATPLCFAAQEDSAGACAALLQGGAEVDARCQVTDMDRHQGTRAHTPAAAAANRFGGYTPLHYAAHYNASAAARVLAAGGRATDVPDRGGRVPLHVAAARGSANVLQVLLEAGARMDTEVASPCPPAAALRRRRASISGLVAEDDVKGEDKGTAGLSRSCPGRGTTRRRRNSAPAGVVPSPISSPILRSLVPLRPVRSSKPWNCVSRDQIEGCHKLIEAADAAWTPETHSVFAPCDRVAALNVLMVGKRMESMGTGIFMECWPMILGFCGRGWFRTEEDLIDIEEIEEEEGKKQKNAGLIPQIQEDTMIREEEQYTQFQMED